MIEYRPCIAVQHIDKLDIAEDLRNIVEKMRNCVLMTPEEIEREFRKSLMMEWVQSEGLSKYSFNQISRNCETCKCWNKIYKACTLHDTIPGGCDDYGYRFRVME